MLSRIWKSAFHTLLIISLSALSVGAANQVPTDDKTLNDPAYKAMNNAQNQNRFLMVYIYESTLESLVYDSYNTLKDQRPEQVNSITISTQKPGESWLVNTYNLKYAPLPMVMVLAPNGAIAGTFSKPMTSDQLIASISISPVIQQCLLAFQKRSLVLLCIQGDATQDNEAAMEGVTQFSQDPIYAKNTKIVTLDPANPEETGLLNQLGLTEKPKTAMTYFFAPPGKLIGKWKGPTSKESLVKQLTNALAQSRSCRDPNCADPSCPPPSQAKQ